MIAPRRRATLSRPIAASTGLLTATAEGRALPWLRRRRFLADGGEADQSSSPSRQPLHVRCLPSPCGRLSRPRTTTKAPPHLRPHSRQRACLPTAGSPRMVPTFTKRLIDGVGAQLFPCSLAASTPQIFLMASAPATKYHHGVASPRGQACTASRPTSARFDPLPRLRGFCHRFALASPSRLTCRTRSVWQYRTVPSLSGLLPPTSRASRTGLPPASATRCDGPQVDISIHSIIQRLVAHSALEAQPGKSQARPRTNARSKRKWRRNRTWTAPRAALKIHRT